jgi:hypothetical protein
MMKNKLKSIILAIAVLAIVIVNNIGFGSFDSPVERLRQRVHARPNNPMEGVIDIQIAPVIRQNYSAGFEYIANLDAYRASNLIWSEGAKGLIEQNIRAAISRRQLRPGVTIYDETINLDSFKLIIFAFDSREKNGYLGVDVSANIQFKTSNLSIFANNYQNSTFRTKLNLQIMLNCPVKNNRVTVDNMTVKMNPDLISSNTGDSRMLSSVDNFLKGEFKQEVESRNRSSAVRNQWAGYIKAAIDRFTPANVLNQ